MYDLVVRSARIVTPDGVVMGDLALLGGVIEAIGQGLGPGREEVEATGMVICPGVVDAQVHRSARPGGSTPVDDIERGTRAAVFGGVTSLIDFTIQREGESLLESSERRIAEIHSKAIIDVGLHCGVTRFDPDTPTQVHELVERGLRSFRVFGGGAEGVLRDGDMLSLAEAVSGAGGLLMAHSEGGDAVGYLGEKLRKANRVDAVEYPDSRPDFVEAYRMYSLATLTRLANCPLYISRLSSARGLEVIRHFREEGWDIHAESCPQYLLLDADAYADDEGHRNIDSPPLRRSADRQALTQAVSQGEIQVIGSGHCPFSMQQKDAGQGAFLKTPGGLMGVETLFSLMFSHLVALGDGGLTPRSNASMLLLARVLAQNPAKLFGLAPAKGSLREGADADFFIFDPNPIRRLRCMDLHSAGDWTPFEGREVRGEIRTVYLRGERMVDGGQLYCKPGFGRYLPSDKEAAG
jgi:dihydropyrimidinase